MTDKEKLISLLPRVGVAAESITAAIELYCPCIHECLEAYQSAMGAAVNREEVFTPEEIALIESANVKLLKVERAMGKYGI